MSVTKVSSAMQDAMVVADLPAGSTVQVVNVESGAVATATTTMPDDNTIPQKTEGNEFMTLAVTPTHASNKLRIDVAIILGVDTGASTITGALFQDDTAGALASTIHYAYNGSRAYGVNFTHYMAAGTTSETTFKVRAGIEDADTVTFNGHSGGRIHGGVLSSSITITEIKV